MSQALNDAIDRLTKAQVEMVKAKWTLESVKHRTEECTFGTDEWRKARDKARHTMERMIEIETVIVLTEAEIEKLRYSTS